MNININLSYIDSRAAYGCTADDLVDTVMAMYIHTQVCNSDVWF